MTMIKKIWTFLNSNLFKYILAGGLALLIFGYLQKCNQTNKLVDDIHKIQSDLQIATDYSNQMKAKSDSVLIEINKKSAKINNLNTLLSQKNSNISLLHKKNDSLLIIATSKIDSTCPCTEALSAAQGFKNETDSLHTVIIAQDSIITYQDQMIEDYKHRVIFETARADSLQTVATSITRMPVHNPDKIFGFIPKPSRTVAFIAGVGMGILVTR